MPLPGQGGKFAMLTNITEELPFELKVLEVVLDFVTTYIEFLSSDLEASAHPVLDTIVQRVRTRALPIPCLKSCILELTIVMLDK